MSKIAAESIVGTSGSNYTYDPTRWTLPDLMAKRTDLGTPFVGPLAVGVARPMEQSATTAGVYPWAMQWANKSGYYATGTVTVSGTTVTGVGSGWKTAGVPVNAKIGFGTTNPDLVTSWYVISAIATDTSITLGTSAGTVAAGSSFVIDMNYKIDWVFLADNTTAGATRKLQLYEYNRLNSAFGWRGQVILTPPAATNHTIKGFRMLYEKYTTGTVQVATATVTGTGTTWVTDRISAGNTIMASRIGFGSTDPTQITTWYYINTVTAEGTLTISTSVATNVAANITVTAGSAYVIEELWAVVVTTNATSTNGGLFLAKGLSYGDFTAGGTTVAAATTVDKIKAVYWIADASTVTNVTACGVGLEPKISWASQFCYVIDSANIKIFKYNIRAPLTLTSGKDSTTFATNGGLITGNQAVTGTLSTTNNCRFAITSHGPASGLPALYFVTTTRIYCVPTSAVTSGSTSFLQYTMTEVPPGGVNTFAATGALACIEYAGAYDRFIITTTGAAGVRSYIAQFRTDAGQMDNIFLNDDKQIDQAAADSGTTPHPAILAVTQTPWSEGGLLYLAGIGTTAATNIVHAIPLGADWNYAATTGQRLISPAISTPNCNKYARAYVLRDRVIGGDNLGKAPDPAKLWYRTSGISDNSGAWTAVPELNDLSGAGSGTQIQFMIEFRTISDFCIPARIYGVGVVYDDINTHANYQVSVTNSDTTNKRFAFRHVTAFGGTVPAMKIVLTNADTGVDLITDYTATPTFGTFEKSTNDGSTWGAYNTTDVANTTTYIRYTPSSLADGIKVRAAFLLA